MATTIHKKDTKINSTLWEVRNTLHFGHSKAKLTREQNRIAPTITNYYETYHHTISTKHYKIFNTPLAQRLTFSPEENKPWINTVKAAQKFYKKEQQFFYLKHTKITRYLKQHKRTAPPNTSQDYNSRKKRKLKNTSQPQRRKLLKCTYTQAKLKGFTQPPPSPMDDPT